MYMYMYKWMCQSWHNKIFLNYNQDTKQTDQNNNVMTDSIIMNKNQLCINLHKDSVMIYRIHVFDICCGQWNTYTHMYNYQHTLHQWHMMKTYTKVDVLRMSSTWPLTSDRRMAKVFIGMTVPHIILSEHVRR